MRANNTRPSSVNSNSSTTQAHLLVRSDPDVSLDNASKERKESHDPIATRRDIPSMDPLTRSPFATTVSKLSQRFSPAPISVVSQQAERDSVTTQDDDDAQSRTSTLHDDLDATIDLPEKTPTPFSKVDNINSTDVFTTALKLGTTFELPLNTSLPPTPTPNHQPGPLERQLSALLSSIIHLERANPTLSVTPADYAHTTNQLKALTAEKEAWTRRRSAIWSLRDEDVENNIKIRGLLAKARRDLEAMTKLRDEDLANVQILRAKLAEATRQTDRLKSGQEQPQQRTAALPIHRSASGNGRPVSISTSDRRQTDDLFAMAKAAALEQRALELEKRNADLVAEVEALRRQNVPMVSSSSASPERATMETDLDALNSVVAHRAWKGLVNKLAKNIRDRDMEIEQLRNATAPASTHHPSRARAMRDATTTKPLVPSNMSLQAAVNADLRPRPESSSAINWHHRISSLQEEHAAYREVIGAKLQALRSEKEALQRDLYKREDECHGLEGKVRRLEARVGDCVTW